MNAPPNSARPASGPAFIFFGRALPATVFVFLLALQLQLLRPELARAFGDLRDVGAVTFVVNRVLSLVFVAGLALVYIARRRPAQGRHDPVVFVVSMYASFVLLAFRPLATLLEVELGINPSPPALVLSNLLVIAGVALSVYSLVYLRFNFSIMPEARKLVTGGPYRLVRHPIYLGEIISGAGLALALPGWLSLIVLVTFIGAQLFRTRVEEEVLSGAFPAYDAYMRHTRYRLIPGLV